MKHYLLIVLYLFIRFLPSYVSGTGFESEARMLGEDLSTLCMCYLAFILVNRKDVALRMALSYIILIISIAACFNFYFVAFGWDAEKIRAIFLFIIAAIGFIGVPLILARSQIEEKIIPDAHSIHIVLKRPHGVISCILSSLFMPCDSCSITIGSDWYVFDKKTEKLIVLDSSKINKDKYCVVATKFRKNVLKDVYIQGKLNSDYKLIKNNCCSVFFGVFDISFRPWHYVPTIFAGRVLNG